MPNGLGKRFLWPYIGAMKKPAKPKAKRGRPPSPDGAMTIYKVRLARVDVRAADKLAKRLKSSRSAAIRHAIQKAVDAE